MNVHHKNLSFCSTSKNSNGIRIKDLSSERMKRNLSSISKEKGNLSHRHCNSSLFDHDSQERSVKELDQIWVKMKKGSLKSRESNSFFKDSKVSSSSLINKYIPKSYIQLNANSKESSDLNEKVNLNPKKHLKQIYQNYSNVYQKKSMTVKSKSPLSTIMSSNDFRKVPFK